MLLFILGLLFFAVGMVLLVIQLAKKKKGKAGIVVLVSVAMMLVGLFTMPNDEKETAVDDESLPVTERAELLVINAVGENNNMKDPRNITVEGDEQLLTITLLSDETMGSFHQALLINTKDVLEALEPMDSVQKIAVILKTSFVDTYGNTKIEDAMRTFIRRDELDKINFENFNSKNLATIAENHFVHPAVQD